MEPKNKIIRCARCDLIRIGQDWYKPNKNEESILSYLSKEPMSPSVPEKIRPQNLLVMIFGRFNQIRDEEFCPECSSLLKMGPKKFIEMRDSGPKKNFEIIKNRKNEREESGY